MWSIGSYGATPIPVIEATRKLADQIERLPDKFMRRDWLPVLNNCRSQVSSLIGAKYDECVIVPNTTNGVNCVVSNIRWQDGDVIVLCEWSTPPRFTRQFVTMGNGVRIVCG